MKQSVCMLFFACFLATAYAQSDLSRLGMDVTEENTPKGLMVGEEAPGFSGVDQYSQEVSLEGMLEEGEVVLIFYRGDWCPVCTRYLKRFQDSLQLIVDAGAQVVAVTPETNNNVQETIKKADAKFRILSDLDHSIMDAYDVTFRVTDAYNERIKRGKGESIEENNGDEEPFLPVPATYIINQDGEIIYRQFDPNYRNRASIAAMIKALE